MDDRLRPLWNFDDLEKSEERLDAQLAREEDDAGRAEVLTQLARIQGLRGDFDAGDALVDDAVALGGTSMVARSRIDLERGRLRRSGGDPGAALPLFESAYALALEADQGFVAADAAHMAALAAPDRAGFVMWTERGIELAREREGASYWLGALLNNLGWEHYEAGEYAEALDAFERALAARERAPENEPAIELARYALGKTLRALGRTDEAIPLLERAVAWSERTGNADGWFHEELAEEYAAIGRADDAREQARLALPLLERDDPSLGAGDQERASRLRTLAGA